MPYVKTTNNEIYFYDDADSLAKYAPAGSVPIADADALAFLAAANAPNVLKGAAKTALNKSDTTALRCFEAGIPLPTAWTAYRKALREIYSGADTVSTTLPAQPPYPAGT